MDYESLLELVKQRRTTHKFKPDPVPDEYIDKIIEVARWAPSGFNTTLGIYCDQRQEVER
jgi:nitroreductase